MTGNTNAEGILQHAVDELVRERDELRAENDRLRAAMEKHHWPMLVPGDGPCEVCGIRAEVWYGEPEVVDLNQARLDKPKSC